MSIFELVSGRIDSFARRGGVAALVLSVLGVGAPASALVFPTSGYTTIITDPVDPAIAPCQDLLSVGYQQDGTDSFFSLQVNCTNVGFNNQRFSIFIDSNGDGLNDYLLWMDNPQKVELYAWQTSGCADPAAAGCWVDTLSPTADFADPNLVPDDTVFLGVASAEIGNPNGFVVGASTATANVKLDVYCNDPTCQGSGDSTGTGSIGVGFLDLAPATVCIGVAAAVTATQTDVRAASATFVWSDPSFVTRFTDASVPFVGGVASSTWAPPDSEGFWKIEVHYFDGGGNLLPDTISPEVDDIYLQVQGPSADAGVDLAVCAGGSVAIGGAPTAFGGLGPYAYAWSPATGLDDATAANPMATPSATTTYGLVVTDQNGCTATSQVVVTVDAPPTADAGFDGNVCPGGSTALGGAPTATGGLGPYTYSWLPTAELDDPTAANPLATPSVTTTFAVTVTDQNGCTATASVTVTVAPCGPDLLRVVGAPPPGPSDLEVAGFASGAPFPNDGLDLTDPARSPVFYVVTDAVVSLRVDKSSGKIVITY